MKGGAKSGVHKNSHTIAVSAESTVAVFCCDNLTSNSVELLDLRASMASAPIFRGTHWMAAKNERAARE